MGISVLLMLHFIVSLEIVGNSQGQYFYSGKKVKIKLKKKKSVGRFLQGKEKPSMSLHMPVFSFLFVFMHHFFPKFN